MSLLSNTPSTPNHIVTLFAVLLIASNVEAGPLSPENWPAGDMEEYSTLNAQRPSPHGLAKSTYGVVSGTSNPLAIHSGTRALEVGGNAMDACLAASAAQVALAAGAYVSYAGIMNIVYYNATSGTLHNINGDYDVPQNIVPSKIPPKGYAGPNGNTVLVPGYFRAFEVAAENYATFSVAELLEPSLYFATNGFHVDSQLANSIKQHADNVTLFRTPEGRKIFTNPDTASLYKEGDLFKQPELAQFLGNISVHGIDYVYNGAWSNEYVTTLASHGGWTTQQDMSRYEAMEVEPRSTVINHTLFAAPGDVNFAGNEVLQSLNLAEISGILDMPSPFEQNATALYWMIQFSRWAFLTSHLYVSPGGPELLEKHFPSVNFAPAERSSKEYAAAVWGLMSAPGGVSQINDAFRVIYNSWQLETPPKHSDGLVAMDEAGNVCAMVHTANSYDWGTGLFVQGVALPNSAALQRATVKGTSPGARLPSSVPPLIALKLGNEFPSVTARLNAQSASLPVSGEVLWGQSTIGSSLSEVGFQMAFRAMRGPTDPATIVGLPYYMLVDYTTISSRDLYPEKQLIPTTFNSSIIQEVEAMGQPVTTAGYILELIYTGYPVMVRTQDYKGERTLEGGATFHLNGIPDAARQ